MGGKYIINKTNTDKMITPDYGSKTNKSAVGFGSILRKWIALSNTVASSSVFSQRSWPLIHYSVHLSAMKVISLEN